MTNYLDSNHNQDQINSLIPQDGTNDSTKGDQQLYQAINMSQNMVNDSGNYTHETTQNQLTDSIDGNVNF